MTGITIATVRDLAKLPPMALVSALHEQGFVSTLGDFAGGPVTVVCRIPRDKWEDVGVLE